MDEVYNNELSVTLVVYVPSRNDDGSDIEADVIRRHLHDRIDTLFDEELIGLSLPPDATYEG